MNPIPIQAIQGPGLFSPLAGQTVSTSGVVTGATGKGFFIQNPEFSAADDSSCGLFVFRRRDKPAIGALVEVTGQVVDFLQDEEGRPTTQLVGDEVQILKDRGPDLEPVWLTAEKILVEAPLLAEFLNRHEGMLVGVEAGSVFTAPSNPFGDYVVLPPGARLDRTPAGGVLIDPSCPERWLPSFRVTDYSRAPQVHVGSELLAPVVGPLNFRVESYQIATPGPVKVRLSTVPDRATTLKEDATSVLILTLNGFNLDPHREDPNKVKDPQRDVDDDVGDGRFKAFGQAIVQAAGQPSLIALQEIQDNDGAELGENVQADQTYATLIEAIMDAGGVRYEWLDIPPVVDADGGQPGGNIRNAYLYDPRRVRFVEGSQQRLGVSSSAFDGSRKPLAARFTHLASGQPLELVNVHLASKRHQNGLFAPVDPGLDPRGTLRVEQAEIIAEHLAELRNQGIDYYLTGDFNDFEFSDTLKTLTADHSTNLVETLPPAQRYDYNHRGISQVLMHGIVARRQLEGRSAQYEIIPGNALRGVRPGRTGDKASDHGYVIARLELAASI